MDLSAPIHIMVSESTVQAADNITLKELLTVNIHYGKYTARPTCTGIHQINLAGFNGKFFSEVDCWCMSYIYLIIWGELFFVTLIFIHQG